MAHYPISEPDPDGLDSARSPENPLTEMPRRAEWKIVAFETDVAELAARFSSDEGGQLSPELSADLALEVVLHEMVEQACAANGASGASVVLERDGEWVCRASSGTGAPELGARLGRDSGLTAECIKTGQVQRCDDTEKDSRVDIEACRGLGVRSLIMLPVLQAEKLIGVFAAFSPRLAAFGEEHERNLKFFSDYVIRSLAPTSEPLLTMEQATEKMATPESAAVEEIGTETAAVVNLPNERPGENKLGEMLIAADSRDRFEAQQESVPESFPAEERRGLKIATRTLAAVVLAFALFLTLVASQRLLGRKTAGRNLPARSHPQGDLASPGYENRGNENQGYENANTEAARAGEKRGESTGAADSAAEAGSLTVYEDGKEVFHAPAGAGKYLTNAAIGTEENAAATPASGVQVRRIYQLSPEDAQREVLLRVDPVYPEQAREQGIEGIVVLRVRAGRDGRVRDVRLVGGQPLLVAAAMAAVKQWQFRPHLVDGQTVEVQTRIMLIFELPR
ncbi:MAG: TonB family protein [Candidatus Sulfotelmatobacter sp.]